MPSPKISIVRRRFATARESYQQTATVCGVVASARNSERARGKPTFLDLDKAYPQQIFTVVILGREPRQVWLP